MCGCSRSTQVQIIGIVCTILTALSGLDLVRIAATGEAENEFTSFYSNNHFLVLTIQSLIYLFHIFTYILLIFGSIKRNKLMLIPFIIITSVHILLLNVMAIFFIYFGTFWYLISLMPVFSALVLAMYFFVTVVQFYREISKVNVLVERPSTVLQRPYNTSQQSIFQGRERPVVVHSPRMVQSPPYTYQQEPCHPELTQEYGYYAGQHSELNTQFWKWKQSQPNLQS